MPRITDFMLLEQPQVPTLVVRTRTRVQDMPLLIGKSYGTIAAYLRELGRHMAGIPFVAYHNMDMQDLDVELGFPVAASLPGKGDIQPGMIPAGLTVACIYQGAYSGLQSAYEEMAKWIQEHGYIPSGVAYECYYNGPEFSESLLLTQIAMPVTRS
jgi:effector-binding domain-containing protein